LRKTADIRRVLVVGAGTIGSSWAALFLAKGLDVTVTDTSQQAESSLRRFVDQVWPILETLGLKAGAARARLRFETSLEEACTHADFVQESATERECLKVALLKDLDAATRPDILIASSSSALTVTTMQRDCRHPERVVLGHPFNPPHLMPLVELVGGERTSPQALDRAENFYAGLGKVTIRLRKEVYGHVANRLQGAVFREAVHLLSEGVASVRDIDLAMTQGPGLRWASMGPFLTYHLAGGPGGMPAFMDQFAAMQAALWDDLGDPVIEQDLQHLVSEAVIDAVAGHTVPELEAMRDRSLLALLSARGSTPSQPVAADPVDVGWRAGESSTGRR
jgi:carnitine 3-dehydrogenase